MTEFQIRQAALDIVWMLTHTVTDGSYIYRPSRALAIWVEENLNSWEYPTPQEEEEILALIEW